MPRTGALLSLSREHHSSLVLARAVRQAAESGDNGAFLEMMKRIEEHWRTILCEHFAREEQLLRFVADGLDTEFADRILIEHAELRMLACGPCELDLSARLHRFGELLAAHVRYEERVLFPQLQSHPSIDSATTEST